MQEVNTIANFFFEIVVTINDFQEEDRKIVVVENTTVEDKVSTSYIFEYGHSTKGDMRGIGLANVKAILDKYPKITLTTNSSNHRFIQELIFID